MSHPAELPAQELDEGTWHERAQVESRAPREDSRAADFALVDSSRDTRIPPATPQVDHESADSDEVTPKSGGERSDQWDLLPPPAIERGAVLFGKYKLKEKIGDGGMGDVWLVQNIELERQTALKLIKADIVRNEKVWRRFRREARLMAKLNHPNAVAIYDFKRTHSLGYIEMEFVAGRSLDKHLKERNREPMPLTWIAQVLDQLCSVLQDAHGYIDEETGKAKPIIHRDLKPSNLMLVDKKPPGQNLKVLDFGIAKMMEDDANPEVTGAGDFLGTPAYVSPEQIPGTTGPEEKHEIDGRSDLYSVGVMLYEFLTGHRPFQGSVFHVMHHHLHTAPPPFPKTGTAPSIPPEVERLVMQCLEKDPEKRPRSARELAERFRAAIGEPVTPPSPPFPWRMVGASALGIVVLVLTSFAFWLRPPQPTPIPEKGGETTATPRSPEPPPDPPASAALGLPEGYVLVSPVPNGSTRVRKVKTSVEYELSKTGAYIPVGYEPESSDLNDLVEGVWPRVIARTSNKKIRFIRIPGKTFHQGDARSEHPAADLQQNPCTQHWVRVSGFYIQQTEVTNEEIQAYLEDHPEAAESLRDWKHFYNGVRAKTKFGEKAGSLPAVCLSYAAARKYAEDMGGRLPTEAEWEFAAKSCNDEFIFPWGKAVPAKSAQRKVNVFDPRGNVPSVGPVGTFAGDRTDQEVFDLAGNVSEFCLDPYESYDKIINAGNSLEHPLVDPWFSGLSRPEIIPPKCVVKGGSFWSNVQKSMAFQRRAVAAESTSEDIGFRIVIECPPAR
jgi:serine/threonine-protein kinase